MQLKRSNVYVVSYERVFKKSRHKDGHSSIIYETVVKIPITSGPRRSPRFFRPVSRWFFRAHFLASRTNYLACRFVPTLAFSAVAAPTNRMPCTQRRWVNGSRRTHIIAGQIILFEILLAKQTCLSRGHDNKCLSLPIRSAGDKGRVRRP